VKERERSDTEALVEKFRASGWRSDGSAVDLDKVLRDEGRRRDGLDPCLGEEGETFVSPSNRWDWGGIGAAMWGGNTSQPQTWNRSKDIQKVDNGAFRRKSGDSQSANKPIGGQRTYLP